jgi:hypothetical protein
MFHEVEAPSRDDFVFAQLMHEGDWDPDPSAIHNLLKYARDNSTLEVKFKRQNVRLKDPKTTSYPLPPEGRIGLADRHQRAGLCHNPLTAHSAS